MDASSNLLNVASTASSTAMPNMGLPAAQAMAAAGASPVPGRRKMEGDIGAAASGKGVELQGVEITTT